MPLRLSVSRPTDGPCRLPPPQCLKWNFSQPRAEFLDQLKDQMTNAGVNKTLMTQMFHSDFKQHIKAIDTLSGVRTGLSVSAVP